MLAFRNITATPSDPVTEWGPEGVLTALERGGLVPIAKVVRSALGDPHGEVADWVLESAACIDRPIAALLAQRIREARDPAVEVARHIRDAVARSGLSLRAFAAQCGTSPSRLSTYATGTTVPAADVLLRIERTSARMRNASSATTAVAIMQAQTPTGTAPGLPLHSAPPAIPESRGPALGK